MKKIFFLFILMGFFVAKAQEKLQIRIEDKETKLPISGAVIHFIGKHYVSDNQGNVFLKNLKKGIFSIRVTQLGYKDFEMKIQIPYLKKQLHISLEEKINELSEVVIYSNNKQINRNNVLQELSKTELKKQSGESLAKMISSLQGVSMIQTGATIAKPVIHGLHSNRILILNNGVRQEGQQWGTEHAPEIDPSSAERIVVIKGADAIRYGSDALGGVILISPDKLPYGDALHTEVIAGFSSNGKKLNSSVKLQGSSQKVPQWAWRVTANSKRSGDLQTADYELNNTGVKELNFSVETGYQKEKWAVEAFYSRYHNQSGIFYGAHIGSPDDLQLRFELGRPQTTFPFTYRIKPPNQNVIHNLLKIRSFYEFSETNKITFQYAFQNDIRREFNARRLDRSVIPTLHLTLNTHSVDATWERIHNHWETQLGVSGFEQTNYNQPGTGVVPPIPNFVASGVSAFGIQRYTKAKWSAEVGLRYDYKYLNASGFDSFLRSYGGSHNFHNLTYTLAGNYNLNQNFSLTSNLGIAWRAPHTHELYSDGAHHGSGFYEIGNQLLTPEIGAKWITSAKYKKNQWLVSADVFVQGIDNYIYDAPTKETRTLFSGVYPIFRYRQADALFRGADISVNYQFLPKFRYEFQASVVYANELKTWGYFPFIPSERFSQTIHWEVSKLANFYNFYASLTHKFTNKQRRFNPAQELVNETPEAYHLFDAEFGMKFPMKKNTLSVHISAENLFDKLYKEYTNRFRYYAHDLGRNVQVRLIFNF